MKKVYACIFMFFIVFGNVFFQNAYAQSVVAEEQKILDAENLYII